MATKQKPDKKTIGVYFKTDAATYADLEAIQSSHGFESVSQTVRYTIRTLARQEKLEKEKELI